MGFSVFTLTGAESEAWREGIEALSSAVVTRGLSNLKKHHEKIGTYYSKVSPPKA